VLACGARKYRASADGAGAIKFRIYTIFAALASSWRCERAVDGGQGGRWPEVKECKRGGTGQLHTPAPAITASLQVYVSIDVVHA